MLHSLMEMTSNDKSWSQAAHSNYFSSRLCGMVAKSMSSGAELVGFNACLHHSIALTSWKTYLTSLSLSFLIFRVR